MIRFISIVLLLCTFDIQAQEGFSVDVVLKAASSMSGDPITLPSSEVAMEAHVVTINSGAEVGRHRHPYPVLMYILEGTLVVEMDDGTRTTYGPGQAFIEDGNTWVANKNEGDIPVKFLAVLTAEQGTPMIMFPE